MHVATKQELQADGSSKLDAPETTEIDLEDEADRWRYTCPLGHRSWSRTNNHLWCKACSQAAQHDETITPEYYEVLDQATGERIPWSAVRIAGEDDEDE